jgi:3-oxoacyl-[acyl-carrier protein] reductase
MQSPNPFSLQGRNALVCGSSKGIGRAIAVGMAAAGANVTLAARNESELAHTRAMLDSSMGQRHDFLIVDFSKTQELKELITYRLKTAQYHILVNNTGGPPPGSLMESREEHFLEAFRNHLLCYHVLATALVPGMKAAGYGRVINVISTSVKVPIKGLGVSNTIRAAVANWSKTLSYELAPSGITVNNVLPGATKTQRLEEIIRNRASKMNLPVEHVEKEMIDEIPMGRFALPEEIAAAAVFLASPAAAYVTGINMPVDGGRTGSL